MQSRRWRIRSNNLIIGSSGCSTTARRSSKAAKRSGGQPQSGPSGSGPWGSILAAFAPQLALIIEHSGRYESIFGPLCLFFLLGRAPFCQYLCLPGRVSDLVPPAHPPRIARLLRLLALESAGLHALGVLDDAPPHEEGID